MNSAEHHIASGVDTQGHRWAAETVQERGAKEAPGGGVEFHSTKRAEYQASMGEGGMQGGAGGGPATGQAAGLGGGVAPGYQDPNKIPIMPGSESASLEGCDQGNCEGLAGSGVGGGGQPGCGPRGYGFGDES